MRRMTPRAKASDCPSCADTKSIAGCRHRAPNRPKRQTVARFVMSALMPRPRDLGERGANSPGEIPGLSAPIPGVLFAFLPFLRNPVRRRTGEKPLFHRHFRVLAAGLEI